MASTPGCSYSFHLNFHEIKARSNDRISYPTKKRIDKLFTNKKSLSQLSLSSSNLQTSLSNTKKSFTDNNLSRSNTQLPVHKPTIIQVNSVRSRPLPPDPNTPSRGGGPSKPPRGTLTRRSPASHTKQAHDELTEAFGGKDERQQAFKNTRNVVQAQIEKLFNDASKDKSVVIPKDKTDAVASSSSPIRSSLPPVRVAETIRTSLPPVKVPESMRTSLPQVAEPPSLPSLSTHPAFRNATDQSQVSHKPAPARVTPEVPPLPKRNTPSPHPSSGSSVSSYGSLRTSSSISPHMLYKVDYLGAIQLTGKATSLDVLQDPLKQLYYIHKFKEESNSKKYASSISITDAGLRIFHNSGNNNVVDIINPYSSIAVWAAIKLVIKKKIGNNGQVNYSYAFLPLICDPEAQNNFNTYYPLNVPDPTIMNGSHPPMFACVMRKLGDSRILECHGFICKASEDAIVIAANLYQALLGTMNSDDKSHEPDYTMSDSEIIPTRPPRRKQSPASSLQGTLRRSSSEDVIRTGYESNENPHRLKKYSIRRNASKRMVEPEKRTSLPNGTTYANLSGENMRDSDANTIVLRNIDDVLKAVINPNGMSFTEMSPQHRELLMKMALILSKDEIYEKSKSIMRSHRDRSSSYGGCESDSDASAIVSVINATKRSISRFSSRATTSFKPSTLKERVPNIKGYNTHQGVLNIQDGQHKDKEPNVRTIQYTSNLNSSLDKKTPKTPMVKRVKSGYHSSYSECDYDSECSSRCYCSTAVKQQKNLTNRTSRTSGVRSGCDTESCAESEKCYCSLKRINTNGLKLYEINLDTETDTTVTNGTMTRLSANSLSRYNSTLTTNLSDSEKFHTIRRRSKSNNSRRTFSTNLHRQSINSVSTGSIYPSNTELKRMPSMRPQDPIGNRSNANLRSTRYRSSSTKQLSIENQPPMRYRNSSGSLGSHGSDHSESSPSTNCSDSQNSDGSADSNSSRNKGLLLSAVDPSGKVVYRGESIKKTRANSETASIMSMKKTAEIAALFSELKLSQKTDLIEELQRQTKISVSDDEDQYEIMQDNPSFMFSDNIENSLGYLP